MSDTYMTLKILYTLDSGATGSYLARSRTPHLVKVVNIPESDGSGEVAEESNSSGTRMMKVGAVHISSVLEEIYQNSPEVLSTLDTDSDQDYNLYYRDICEYEEPLVSLGLLSQLRKKLDAKKEQITAPVLEEEQDSEDAEEEEFIVTGRVCSNLSALLRRSYSNMKKKSTTSNTPETLEVKLRFTRMMRTPVTRKSYNESSQRSIQQGNFKPQAKTYQHPIHANQNRQSSVKSKPKMKMMGAPAATGTNNNNMSSNRRQTNPMPAPKAKRTQSLPIWNLKPGNGNNMYLKNSIAHKIYMADRQTDGGPVNPTFQTPVEQQEAKPTVDESVSKRFEFMLGKKKSSNVKQTKKGNSSKKEQDTETQLKTKKNKKNRTKSNDFKKPMLSVNQENNLMYDSLLSDNTPQSEIYNDARNYNENKENIPPTCTNTGDINNDLDMINFEGINLKGDMNWLNSFNPFDYQNSTNNQPSSKGLNSTPQDINTCNTVTIENEEDDELQAQNDFNPSGFTHEVKSKFNNEVYVNTDIDKTSPIDNLSMPLLDMLDDKSKTKTKNSTSVVLNIEVDDNDDEDDENMNEDSTSIMANNSTPVEQSTISRIAPLKKSISSIEEEDDEDEEEEEEDHKRMSKKRRTIPSSPSMMFSYHDASPNSEITNDLFTSFMNNNDASGNEENHDTPATICPTSDPAQKNTPC
ncbi:Spt21p [Nakaseomyces bracarensis]|uniref:Spt21p n=1 Tax=Nakaseomyces bracarensis TaxID=273131 RepID=UPI0038716A1D